MLISITVLHELNFTEFIPTYLQKDLILKQNFHKKRVTEENPSSVSGHLEQQPLSVKYTSMCVFSDKTQNFRNSSVV